MKQLYIWCDIETTGLDHTEDHLLEIGAVATSPDLQQAAVFSRVACLPPAWVRQGGPDTWPLDDTVRAMHTTNGLLDDCAAAVFGPDEDDLVDAFLLWCTDIAATADADLITIAGSGVAGFDVPWLKARADPFGPWPFHYRILDLSPVRMLLRLAGIDIHLDASSGPGKAHRALDDALAHLAEARSAIQTLTRMSLADALLGAMIDVQDGPHAQPPGGEV